MFESVQRQLSHWRWWKSFGRPFASEQWRRLVGGSGLGCLLAIVAHLFFRDTVFSATLRRNWKSLPSLTMFQGVSEYRTELLTFFVIAAIAIALPSIGILERYLRAWWAGIVSLTTYVSAVVTALLLWNEPLTLRTVVYGMVTVGANIGFELWHFHKTGSARQIPSLDIPIQKRDLSAESRWQASSSDDPIAGWNQDIVGRASVVELLAEHIFVHRTPIVALHGGFGDGKSSVLRLLNSSLARRAITVSFSTWLPGSEQTLAIDLFRDIATECRKVFYIPQLRKRALAYARTISGSVSFLAGLREMLPTESQQEEIEELRDILARVPVPIVVLLDEVDRMQRDEIVVLLKILRGASSIPNITFVCAFSGEEIKKQLSTGAPLSYDYLEKFFPVSVNLAPPDPAMIGRLLQARIKAAAHNGNWFLGTNDKTFGELLDRLWSESLSQVCTNLRRTNLLLNDLSASARIIGGEVNTLDLVGIETIRRFAPATYELVRKNPTFLTYGADSWTKRPYVSDKRKEKEANDFLARLEHSLAQSSEPKALGYILSLLFPAFNETRERLSLHSIVRPTDEGLAEQEKRICDSDYFPVYFRAAVPEDMFSEAELSATVARFNKATTEAACEEIFRQELERIPQHYAKRADFLWKLARAVRSQLNDSIAKWVAYAAAHRATDYTYDLVNIGEAARALNIVFESAQRFSGNSVAQEILLGTMERAADDTFAVRLLEYTENRERNKILTNFQHIDLQQLKTVFMERMRRRYGEGVDATKADIKTGDPQAFRKWIEHSVEDQTNEASFWRRYIGLSRKRLAQAIDFIYPSGFSWSEDPRLWIQRFIPVEELQDLLEKSKSDSEQLDEGESNAIARYQELMKGKWFDIARPDTWEDAKQNNVK